jgi:small-conductance mechanosensitive channel
VVADMLRSLSDLTRFDLATWETRYQLATGSDPAQRRAAYERLGQFAAEVGPWRRYIEHELEVVRGHIADAEAAAQATAPEAAADARARLAAWREREAVLVRAEAATAREARKLALWQDEFKARLGTRTPRERLDDAWAVAAQATRTAWNFELFSADDSVEIDGRKVTVTRSVTVGKSVGAVALLVLGYVLSAWLLRRGERAFVRRFHGDASAARIARRWLQVLVVAALFVLALDLVKIPLTVFAFLGGALAIGVGFGAQNLIKNFMSGILLLAERPIKLGDIVEIGGVVGTVTNISIRACTIRSAEGIETLVPNSTFVESNVTNWTLSNRRVRRSVKVAVAYGSDTRQVTDVLRGVAERHGQLLGDPPPRVIFEDFGADGLAFALEYWIDFSQGIDSRQIASDLRYMIARALEDSGIEIPFPQRDLHLAGDAPLRVEVVARDPGAAARRAAQG